MGKKEYVHVEVFVLIQEHISYLNKNVKCMFDYIDFVEAPGGTALQNIWLVE